MSSRIDPVRLTGVSKAYRPGVGRARIREATPPPFDRLLEAIFPRWWTKGTFNALEEVSLGVSPGASVGIVGHNGAGKTTLLKVIARVTAPSAGQIETRGRVAALIDVLVGFHPELTGRENVQLLGSMHGFGRRAMKDRLDEILAFADIEELVDTPLKRFSAGMATRLGFGTITVLEPSILLIDEVLAVGDAGFQSKCMRWLDEYRAAGGTLIFVSHNLALVRGMTTRVVWLDHGRVLADGPTDEVLPEYVRAMEQRTDDGPIRLIGEAAGAAVSRGLYRWGAGDVRVKEVHIEQGPDSWRMLEVSISYGPSKLDEGVFLLSFLDEGGAEVGGSISGPVALNPLGDVVTCAFQPVPLRGGIFFPVVTIASTDGRVYDRWRLDRAIVVDAPSDPLAGLVSVQLPGKWLSSGPDTVVSLR